MAEIGERGHQITVQSRQCVEQETQAAGVGHMEHPFLSITSTLMCCALTVVKRKMLQTLSCVCAVVLQLFRNWSNAPCHWVMMSVLMASSSVMESARWK